MNHRSAWCEERRAPQETTGTAKAESPGRRRRIARPGGESKRDSADDEILIVASRLKAYIDRKSGMKTSADVLPVLSDMVREAASLAIENARDDGRRTVKARDFRRR
jgi:histone H3/H4